MAHGDEASVCGTTGQIVDMVHALIDAAYDKEPHVQEVICNSLCEVGKKRPNLVLASCHGYLLKHCKLGQGHRTVTLTCMERVVKETSESLDKRQVVDIIKQASSELTASKDVVPVWQSAASGLLVAIGCHHCNEVMAELLRKFQPGVLPHYMVVQTLANLAVANVYDMVPFLKVLLGTTLSVMGMAKQDNMKWIFSSAVAKFSEAIMDYAANVETAPDPSVRKEVYSQEMDAAYDILFILWLQSKEVKLKLIVVEALGRMSYIMSRTKLEEQFPRLLPAILGLYRRNMEPYNITLGLSLLLDAVVQNDSTVVGMHLDNLLCVAFPQICQPVDYSMPMTVKNHNEVLRCFAILVVPFSDRLVNYLLQKLEPNNDKTKMAVLVILRHLINSAGPHIEDKQALIMSGLKTLLPETSNKVKKVLAQTVIAMAHHNYLEMEGGHLYIEFIVRQCALPSDPQGRRPSDPDYVSNDALRSMCDDVLLLLSTTVDNMQCVLWPYLLECVVPQCYTDAMATVCRTIAHIAGKKREEKAQDYLVDFQHRSDIPKPPALIARLMVMAGHPLSGRRRGVHVLTAMKAMSPLMHERLVELWDAVTPKLIQYVEDGQQMEGEEEWSQKNWEDLLLKLLTKSLEELSDENWICDIGRALMEQLSHCTSCAKDKNFLLKCLGIVLRRATTTLFVQQCLHDAFSQVQHLNDLEREGFAIAAGFAAATHLDSALEVIARLDAANKKSSGGLFSFIKDTKSESEEKCKATVILSYGYMSLYAPVSLIPSRLETIIQKTINPQFTNVKDTCVKENLIQTVEMIGRAMHPTHLRTTHNFTYRNDLLLHMQNFLKTEKPGCLTSPIRALTLNACTTLITLEPTLSDTATEKLLETALTCVLVLPPDGSGGKWLKEETYEEHVEHERLMKLTMTALADLLKQMLCKDCTPEGLEVIFKHLHAWTRSRQDHERQRAMQLCVALFSCMCDNMHLNIGTCAQFSRTGTTLARLVPRCTDPQVTVREAAIDCIQSVLRIEAKFEGPGRSDEEISSEGLLHLKEKAQHNDPSVLFSIVNDIAKVLIKKVPSSELMLFLSCLMEALLDPQAHSSSGACVILNSVLKARGGELHSQVDVVLSSLYGKMGEITCRQTRTGAIRAVRTLMAHQLLTVLNLLLNYPLPFDVHICECWRVVGEDVGLLAAVLSHLLELLSTCLPYEEVPCTRDKGRTIRTATLMPVAVTCALKEIFSVEESKVEVMNCYPRLLAAMLVRIASTVGTDPPKVSTEERRQSRLSRDVSVITVTRVVNIDPCATSIDACKQLLQQNQSDDLLTALDHEGVWSLLKEETAYHDGFTLFARCLVVTQPQYAAKLITCLCGVSTSVYPPQRVMVAAVIAELVCHRCTGDLTLVDMLINNLLGWLIDTSSVVRKLCIRGLGNIASLGPQLVQKYATTVLSAMMAGMDDKDDLQDEITLEAMSGLSKILSSVDETQIRAILINISLRIRPCFEKERSTIREAAFTLFGNLSQFGDGPSKDNFFEQIHTNLISFLLHLNDPDARVRKACKQTLRQLGPLIGSESMNTMFQRHLLTDAQLIYGEFINELTKVMMQDFEPKLNFYVMNSVSFFRSSWPEIRSNAALFIGFLLGNMPKEMYHLISREHVSGALILLLQDPSVVVKTRAAEAMSGLCYF